MKKKKVLIVDDDVSLLEALRIAVEMEGYEVLALSDGARVCSAIKTFRPNLVFLDVLLAGIDGRDVSRDLKENVETRDIPVVMLSASARIEDVVVEAKADGFLAKPFELEELWSVIRSYC